MEEQNPDFEVPEATKQMTKQELSLLLPVDESENALIYNGLQKIFYDEAREPVVHMQPRQKSAKKRPQPDKGA